MIPSAIFLGALLPLSYASLFLDIEKQRHGTVLPGSASASATDNSVPGGWAWKRYAGITLAVLFIVWLKWPTEATWKAVWRSRGLPTTAAELDAWYGTVPPERNLANIYLAVEKETSARDKAFWKEWEQYLPRDDTKFAYDHIKAWNWGGLRVGQRMDSVTWQWTNRYREAVVKPALTLLFEALDAGIEDTRWPVNYEADPWDPLGSIGSTARTLVWTLSKELVSCVIQDDADKAVQAANAMLRASACLRERPDELSFLVQAALVPAAIGGLEESLNRAEFSAGQLEKVKASLQKVRPGSLGKLLMPSRMGAIARIEFFAGPENILGVPPELVFARGLLGNGDLATGIMCHYCSTEFNCKGDSVGGCEAALDLESLRIVPGFWPNSYEALFGREVMARFDLACTAIAVEQCRLAHGTVPDSLDALVPEFLEQVPDDPLGPGPIRYVIREHGECVLYSVGPNFVDDGGTRAERYCEGDITFAVLPPAMRAQLREIVPVEEGQGG